MLLRQGYSESKGLVVAGGMARRDAKNRAPKIIRYFTGVYKVECQVNAIELKIIRGLAAGLQSKELAASVGRSTPTVEMYVRRLYRKLSARSRAHIVALAFASGILEREEVASG